MSAGEFQVVFAFLRRIRVLQTSFQTERTMENQKRCLSEMGFLFDELDRMLETCIIQEPDKYHLWLSRN